MLSGLFAARLFLRMPMWVAQVSYLKLVVPCYPMEADSRAETFAQTKQVQRTTEARQPLGDDMCVAEAAS